MRVDRWGVNESPHPSQLAPVKEIFFQPAWGAFYCTDLHRHPPRNASSDAAGYFFHGPQIYFLIAIETSKHRSICSYVRISPLRTCFLGTLWGIGACNLLSGGRWLFLVLLSGTLLMSPGARDTLCGFGPFTLTHRWVAACGGTPSLTDLPGLAEGCVWCFSPKYSSDRCSYRFRCAKCKSWEALLAKQAWQPLN